MLQRFLTLACGLATLFVAACSGRTSTDSEGGPPRDQLIDAYAHASCDDAQPCCSANGFGYDATTCVKVAHDELTLFFDDPSLAAATYDAVAAQACLDAIRRAVQACAPIGHSVSDVCGSIFYGTKALGATCTSSADCARPADGVGSVECISWSTYDGTTTSSGSLCQLHLPAAEGAKCDSFGGPSEPTTVNDCETTDGFACGSDGLCHSLRAVGAACGSGVECVRGAYCSGGSCVAGGAIGATCDDVHPCGPDGSCSSAASGTCVAKTPNGGACTSDATCTSSICRKNRCVSTEIADAPMCQTG